MSMLKTSGRPAMNLGRLFAAALAAVSLLTVPVAAGTNGTWSQVGTAGPYYWDAAGNWTGNTIADGIDGIANFTTAGLTGPFTVTLGTGAGTGSNKTIGTLNFSNPNNYAWTIDGQSGQYSLNLQTSSGTPTINVVGGNQTATINAAITGSQGFTKTGAGNLVLSGLSTYSGDTTINGGTLTLNYPAIFSGTILPASTNLNFGNSGSLAINVDVGQSVNQSVAGIVLNAGSAMMSANLGTGGTLNFTAGPITRNGTTQTGTVLFSVPTTGVTATTSTMNTATTILGGWSVLFVQPVNNNTTQTAAAMGWATVNAGTGALTPLAAYASDTWLSGNNTTVTVSGTTTITTGTTNSLRYNNSNILGYTTALAGGASVISSGGILVTSNINTFTPLVISSTGGSLTSGNGTDLIVSNYSPPTMAIPFAISAPIVDNGATPIGLTTGGPATTVVSGVNTYTGGTTVGGGTLLASSTSALPGFATAGKVVVTSGANLAVSTTSWTSANVDTLVANATFQSGGPFVSSALAFEVPTNGTFTYASNVGGGLGLSARNDVLSNGNALAPTTFAGTLTLTGNSTYGGPTSISGGATLSVGTLAAAGASSPIGAGSVINLGTGGALQYTGGNVSLNRTVNLGLDGGAINVGTAGTTLTLTGTIVGTAGLTMNGPGTLALAGNGMYTGPTVVAGGQLNVNTASALPAGTDLAVYPGASVQFANGVSPNLGALIGTGTVNFGNAASVSIGNNSASGVFRGGISGALALVKNGTGTQVLAGASTYNGGTTVNGGIMQVSPQASGVNPLGTGTVTLAGPGGTGQTQLAFRQIVPLNARGYNQDVIWDTSEAGSTVAARQGVSFAFDGASTFYAAGTPGGLTSVAAGGFPTNRAISPTSLSGLTGYGTGFISAGALSPGNNYVLQPYTANNALILRGQTGYSTGSLSLLTQEAYKSVNLLVAAGNGAGTLNTTFNFTDNSSVSVNGSSVPDWFTASSTTNLVGGFGRFNIISDTYDTTAPVAGNPRLNQLSYNLANIGGVDYSGRTLASITFTSTAATTSNSVIAVLGLNGVATAAPSALSFTNSVAITADSTLELSGYTSVALGALTVGTNSVTVNGTAGSLLTFSSAALTGAPTFTVASGVTANLGTISDGNAGFGYTKAGTGTMIITGGSNYAGGAVTLSAGILDIGSPSALPGYASGQLTIASGATLVVGIGGAGQWTGAQIGATGMPGTLLGSNTFPSGSSFGLDVATGNTGTLTTAGGFTLPTGVGFSKLGGGTLIMNGPNTYTGVTSILGGELSTDTLANGGLASGIGQSSNIAGNLIFANGALLRYTGASASTDRSFTLNTNTGFGALLGGGFDVTTAGTALTLSGAGSGLGMFTKAGAGTVILTGANSYTGGTTISGGTLQVGGGGTTGALGSGVIVDNGTLAYNLSVSATQSNIISGTGGVTKLGGSTLTLSGANTYLGPTVVSTGTLLAGNASAFGTNSAVSVAAGATLSLNAFNVAIGSLAGPAGATVNDNTATATTLTVGGDNTSTTYAGTIVNGSTGALSLVKVGTGTLTLTGANTYTGGTTVNDGTLAINADSVLGTGAVSLSAFGTLAYSASTTTTKSFVLGNGTLAVAQGATVTLNGSSVSSGYLGGSGTFATSTVTAARLGSITTQPTVTVVTNNAADRFVSFSNSGALNVAAGLNSSGASTTVNLNNFINQGLGTITVGAQAQENIANFQSYGTLTVLPATVTENFSQTTLVTNLGTSPIGFNAGSRTFLGTPQTAVFPQSWPDPTLRGLPTFVAGLDLHGQNAIVTSALFVNNGYVEDSTNNFQGTATIVADYGALVKGAGYFQNTVITINGGKFQAGNSPGKAVFGSLNIGPSGLSNFNWQINNATGTGGPSADANNQVSGWSQVVAAIIRQGPTFSTGNLNWSATNQPGQQFSFSLQTLQNPTTVGQDIQGAMANFDPNAGYIWPVFGWAGAYTGPLTDTALTATVLLDTSTFVNPHPQAFSFHLDLINNQIDLVYGVPEPGSLALVTLAAGGWLVRRRFVRRKA